MEANYRCHHSERGFSLIELLIALTIGVIIASAMAGLYTQLLSSREQVNRTSQRIENGRYALDAMADDIRVAGYFGDLSPATTTTWSTADPCAATLADLQAQWSPSGPTLPVPIMGYEGHGLTPAAPACLTNRKANTDIVAIRRVATTVVAPASVSGTAAMQVSTKTSFCSTPDPSSFVISNAAGDLVLHQTNCTGLAMTRALVVRIYYVATCNICSGTGVDTTPTLKVAELANGAFTIRSVSPGIDDLHLEYGIDSSSNDGSTDEYRLSTNNGTVDTKNWQDVVSAKVYVIARDLQDAPNYTNNDTFTLGTKTVAAFADHVKRNVASTTVRLTNVSGRRELP